MRLIELTIFLVTLAVIFPILYKLYADLKEQERGFTQLWEGIVRRGFLEAEETGHLTPIFNSMSWEVSSKAREIYAEKKDEFRALRLELAIKLGREPTNGLLGRMFENKYQQWFVNHACPTLGVNSHGCLAIACIIAQESKTVEIRL